MVFQNYAFEDGYLTISINWVVYLINLSLIRNTYLSHFDRAIRMSAHRFSVCRPVFSRYQFRYPPRRWRRSEILGGASARWWRWWRAAYYMWISAIFIGPIMISLPGSSTNWELPSHSESGNLIILFCTKTDKRGKTCEQYWWDHWSRQALPSRIRSIWRLHWLEGCLVIVSTFATIFMEILNIEKK